MNTKHATDNVGAALAILVLTAVSSPATLTTFQLSPPGTDVAVGLSPSNEVPPSVSSTGSGNTIGGGIVFDSETSTLQMAIGYGSAAGFTDLTGAATAMHIHGPAAPGENAGVLVSLVPYNFPAANPAHGGVIFGTIPIPTSVVASLLAGSNYVNIHTVAYPAGETRGQLIPLVNQAPVVSCPPPAEVECGTAASLTAQASDPDGDALQVVWSVNGTAVQTNQVPASSPPATNNVTFSGEFPLGTNVVDVTVTDSATNTASCSTTVVVVDTTPPSIDSLTANPAILWPPFGQMVSVQIQASISDDCDSTTWRIVSAASNEPAGRSPDWVITGDHTLQLRAQRLGTGTGRVYTITVDASDEAGNFSSKTVTVTVPHDLSRN